MSDIPDTKYIIYVRRIGQKRRTWFMNCANDKELREGIKLVLKHYKGVVEEFTIRLATTTEAKSE